jgi:hypothetical protein
MFYNILGSFAQFYREQLAENVRMGMHQAVRQGKWINRPKTGYDLIDGELVPKANPIVSGQALGAGGCPSQRPPSPVPFPTHCTPPRHRGALDARAFVAHGGVAIPAPQRRTGHVCGAMVEALAAAHRLDAGIACRGTTSAPICERLPELTVSPSMRRKRDAQPRKESVRSDNEFVLAIARQPTNRSGAGLRGSAGSDRLCDGPG